MVQLTVVALAICFIAPTAHAQPGFTEFALSGTTLNSDPSTDSWIAAGTLTLTPTSLPPYLPGFPAVSISFAPQLAGRVSRDASISCTDRAQ